MYYNIVILTYLLISSLETENGNNECIVTRLNYEKSLVYVSRKSMPL